MLPELGEYDDWDFRLVGQELLSETVRGLVGGLLCGLCSGGGFGDTTPIPSLVLSLDETNSSEWSYTYDNRGC